MSGNYKKSLETGKKALQANPDSESIQEKCYLCGNINSIKYY